MSRELYGVFEAVSIGSRPYKGEEMIEDGPRSLTLMMQPGTEDDPYGGWKQVDSLHKVGELDLPEGVEDNEERGNSVGYDDDNLYEVYLTEEGASIEVA